VYKRYLSKKFNKTFFSCFNLLSPKVYSYYITLLIWLAWFCQMKFNYFKLLSLLFVDVLFILTLSCKCYIWCCPLYSWKYEYIPVQLTLIRKRLKKGVMALNIFYKHKSFSIIILTQAADVPGRRKHHDFMINSILLKSSLLIFAQNIEFMIKLTLWFNYLIRKCRKLMNLIKISYHVSWHVSCDWWLCNNVGEPD
jgi:hypothetical protein